MASWYERPDGRGHYDDQHYDREDDAVEGYIKPLPWRSRFFCKACGRVDERTRMGGLHCLDCKAKT